MDIITLVFIHTCLHTKKILSFLLTHTLQTIYIGKCFRVEKITYVEKLLHLKMDCCENLLVPEKLFDLKFFLD
jgi:hypothetical protein